MVSTKDFLYSFELSAIANWRLFVLRSPDLNLRDFDFEEEDNEVLCVILEACIGHVYLCRLDLHLPLNTASQLRTIDVAVGAGRVSKSDLLSKSAAELLPGDIIDIGQRPVQQRPCK